MVYNSPYIAGQYNPLYQTTNQGFEATILGLNADPSEIAPSAGGEVNLNKRNEKRLETTSGNKQIQRSIHKTTNYICHDHSKSL